MWNKYFWISLVLVFSFTVSPSYALTTLLTGGSIADDTIVLREKKGSPLSTTETDWNYQEYVDAINEIVAAGSGLLYEGETTQVLVGGGIANSAVWTTATGTGAPVRAGAPTFTSFPITPSGYPTSDYQVANKKYVDANAGSIDTTTVDATTWSDGANTSNLWTFNLSGTNPTLAISSGQLAVGGTLSATTYGSDGSISNAELLTIDDGSLTQIPVGGGVGSAMVWTTATGTGAPVRASAPAFTAFPTTPVAAPTSDYQVANKKYVDDNAGSGGSVATDTIWDAAGDLVYGTGSNTAARLAAGATTEVLVGGGAGAPVWTTATGTGAPVRAGSPAFTSGASFGGAITIADGSQGASKVLTSDANGLATWASLGGAEYRGEIDGDDGVNPDGIAIDGVGTEGWYYACNDAGTYDYGDPNGNSITLAIGDQLYYDGAVWLKVPGAGSYTLPAATAAVLGGVIAGTSLQITVPGVLNIEDKDMGDITTSATGSTWTIDNDAVTYSKIQNVSATDKVLGRSTAGAGVVEEITLTAAGRALIDDASAAAQRTTLGISDEVYTLVTDYAGLNTALTGNDPWVIVGANITLTGVQEVLAGTTLSFLNGSVINLDTFDLTITGMLDAARVQVFNESSTGEVVLSPTAASLVYPEWWGAIADDAGDDTAAIQNAMNAMPQDIAYSEITDQGGMVSFGSGIYKIASTITIGGAICVEGVNWESTQILASSDIIMFHIYSSTDGIHQYTTVRDMTLSNSSSTTSVQPNIKVGVATAGSSTKERMVSFRNLHLYAGGMEIWHTLGTHIDNVFIKKPYVGLYVRGNNAGSASINLEVNHVDIQGARSYGIHFDEMNDAYNVSNTTVWYNAASTVPIYLDNTTSYNNWGTWTQVDVLASENTTYCWLIEGSHRVKMYNCHIEGTSGKTITYGLYVNLTNPPTGYTTQIDINDCYIKTLQNGYYFDNPLYARVRDSWAQDCSVSGFKIVADGDFAAHNVFDGNVVYNTGATDPYSFQIYETGGGTAAYNAFRDNACYNQSTLTKCMDVSDDDNVILSNNVDWDTWTVFSNRYENVTDISTTKNLATFESGTTFSATSGATFNLPPITTVGTTYTIINYAGGIVYIHPYSGDSLWWTDPFGTGALNDNDKIKSVVAGGVVTVVALDTRFWYITNIQGTWTDEGP